MCESKKKVDKLLVIASLEARNYTPGYNQEAKRGPSVAARANARNLKRKKTSAVVLGTNIELNFFFCIRIYSTVTFFVPTVIVGLACK